MAIRVPYTHGYYRFLNVFAYVTYFIWLAIVWSVLAAIWALLGSMGLDLASLLDSLDNNSWWLVVRIIALVLGFLYFACVCMLAGYLNAMTTGRWIHTLSTWLYVRITLRTPLSLTDAASVMWLFVPNETGKWHPMEELLTVPVEQRRELLLASAARIERDLLAEQLSGQ